MQTDWYEIAQDRKAWYDSCKANLSQRIKQQITNRTREKETEKKNYYVTSRQHAIVQNVQEFLEDLGTFTRHKCDSSRGRRISPSSSLHASNLVSMMRRYPHVF